MVNIAFVDENDIVIGAGTKREALEKGYIVRIVRIFVFNSQGEVLLQKRAPDIAAGGLWDQSVGGHVDEGEDYLQAAHREMEEELGIRGIEIEPVAKYFSDVSLVPGYAKRFNMLYIGAYDGEIRFNRDEVEAVRWVIPDRLFEEIEREPHVFTKGMVFALKTLRDSKRI